MKTVLLTTETLHHAYFVREVNKRYPFELVIIQRNTFKAPFDTSHSFETERDEYERKELFKGKDVMVQDFAPVLKVNSINEDHTVERLKEVNPDIIIVFGTDKIAAHVLEAFPNRFINLHGGDPEYYRGLDSHLWAIYHNDFEGLAATIHVMNDELDDGEILQMLPINIQAVENISQLRRYNTDVCIELTLNILNQLEQGQGMDAAEQSQKGRYYSFMPSALKDICVKNFERYKRKQYVAN